MKGRPYTVAVVGRPNVGKSALFNRFIGKRKAIVHDVEGITRDRLYATNDIFGKEITFIDTGGISSQKDIAFADEIRDQTLKAIEDADLLVMVADVNVGITIYDQTVANLLLKRKKPVILAVNKVDDTKRKDSVSEFYSLGIEEVFPVSASHGNGVADLLEWISERAENPPEEEESQKPKVAILGRPNVGKSTLFNALIEDDRSVVSDIAGTTRDAVDVETDDFIYIDTAGLKKTAREKEVVEKFATIRTKENLERADVVIFVIDATSGLTTWEKRILTEIEEAGKGCILYINKWDLTKGVQMEGVVNTIRKYSSFLNYVPIIIGSAKTKRNIEKLPETILTVYENFNHRISTGELNSIIERAQQLYHPPMMGTRRLRIYYLTQVKSSPPTFCLFVNDPKIMATSYKRYLYNTLRKAHPFTGVPLHFHLKARKREKQKARA